MTRQKVRETQCSRDNSRVAIRLLQYPFPLGRADWSFPWFKVIPNVKNHCVEVASLSPFLSLSLSLFLSLSLALSLVLSFQLSFVRRRSLTHYCLSPECMLLMVFKSLWLKRQPKQKLALPWNFLRKHWVQSLEKSTFNLPKNKKDV